jgi:hypothetical protein
MESTEIPQIKPASVLDPPQIKLAQEVKLTDEELHRGSIEADPSDRKKRFTIPKLDFRKLFRLRKPRLGANKKWVKKTALVLGVLIILLAVFVVIPGVGLAKNAVALSAAAKKLSDSANSQDIAVVKSEMQAFQSKFNNFKGSFNRFRWTAHVPFIGVYWQDGDAALKAGTSALDASNIIIETIEPYADIIGFGGADAGGDTANDRIEFLIQTIDDILPRADEIVGKAREANLELKKIDPKRYPQEFNGKPIRSKLTKYLDLAEEASNFIAESKPLLEAAPYLLGTNGTRTYLLLFQNDKELRPTGGFITAYSIVEVTNGKIQPVSSNDIYNLDGKYTPSIEAPEVIKKYLKGPYLISENIRLRDMNWSPDFRESMDLFLPEAMEAGISGIDGIIAVDTHVVVNILSAIGQVEVPGFGVYSNNHDERCDCPQVIYELESFADVEGPIVWSENEPGKIVFAPPNYLNRKEIVGPLMNSILSNALGQPKEKLPALIEAGWRSLTEKHILLYMLDEKAQAGAEAFGAAGRVEDFEGDYLQIVDANLAGRKSNLYVTQEVLQNVEVDRDGSVTKTVEITYQNPQDYDGWLNSVLPNWTRIYIPKGSELISQDGFEDPGEIYEELGKTVISGGFELRPKGIKKISVKYKLPFKAGEDYKLLIQKQAGTDAPLYTVNVDGETEEFYLKTDRTLRFRI